MGEAKSGPGPVNRRSFIKASAGVAAGAAAVTAPAAIAAERAGAEAPRVIKPSSAIPAEPVTAFIRDAAKGEVTVMSGTRETTYRDRALVDRLVAAAQPGRAANAGGSR